MKNLMLTVLALALLTSCASADKMLDRGDYDGLINLAARKLAGKKKKEAYVIALEEGVQKVTQLNMARIEALRLTNSAEAWEDIVSIAKKIQNRQDKISPLLPLISENGYKAEFTFVRTGQIISEAKSTAVNLYEKRLVDMVTSARQGNKASARNAYNLIDHIRSIGNEYTYRQDLRDEMRHLGINKIFVSVENKSHTFMPVGFEEELLALDYGRIGGSWDRFYTRLDENENIDYHVILEILDVRVGGEEWAEKHFPVSKEIVDGWEYVLDENGNVAKDSLGNDIKRDRIVHINATVVEMIQSKRALVSTRLEVVNVQNGARTFSRRLEIEDSFSHVARNIFGDERALEPNQRQRILPVGFPSDASLIWNAFQGLKPKLHSEMRRANYTI
jgi:hypothetical protein